LAHVFGRNNDKHLSQLTTLDHMNYNSGLHLTLLLVTFMTLLVWHQNGHKTCNKISLKQSAEVVVDRTLWPQPNP